MISFRTLAVLVTTALAAALVHAVPAAAAGLSLLDPEFFDPVTTATASRVVQVM